ncbi:MAG: AfsR/SARP family transcriptional regulator [Bacillota bacterium]
MIEYQLAKQMLERGSTLQIYCFGVFRVVRPGEAEPIGIISKHKMWALFKYLITHKGTAVATAKIMELLWPGNRNPADTATLRTTVSRLKSLLEPKSANYRKSSYIVYCKDSCAFNIHAPFWLDADEFERLCNIAHRNGNSNRKEAIDCYIKALELYQGDFLAEDPDLEWALIPREYYRRLFIESSIEVTTWLIEMQDFSRANGLLKRAIKIDPYIEELQILLMKTLLGMGDLKTAAEHYSYYSGLLYRELGVKPSEEWKRLYRQIREAEGDTPNRLILEGHLEQSPKDTGPLVCDSDFFWNFLLFERRRIARNGGESSLVVLELDSIQENNIKMSKGEIASLEAMVYQKLRKCDVVCRLDNSHLALLLPYTGSEGSKIAVSQINDSFFKHFNNSDLLLQIKVKRVTPL